MKSIALAAAAAAALSPSPAQVAGAVRRATHSRALWATVNVCDTSKGIVGIRGQMPALGFPARLRMTIHLRYWNAQDSRFEPIPQVAKRLALGSLTHGTVQDGVEFTFRPPVTLQGSVTFEWRRHGRLIGSATRTTTGSHRGVDDSQPPGYNAPTCRLGT